MHIALIGDVHANLPALEAVLEHATARGAESVWNAGDATGYGAFPDEVVRRLSESDVTSVIGNYDQKVLRFDQRSRKWQKTKRHEKWLAFRYAWRNLSEQNRTFLASLPEQRRLEAEGHRILLCHGSPASVDEHLYSTTPKERMRELADIADADLVVCGHSHEPYRRQVGDVLFVNTGSVGRADDGDPRASYALAEFTPSSIAIEHFRVDYDIARAVAAVRENGLPEAFVHMLERGRSFDGVMAGE